MVNVGKNDSGQWSIWTFQAQLGDVAGVPIISDIAPVVGATHNFLALVDPSGNVVAELQGGPSGPFTNAATPGNYLSATTTSRAGTYPADSNGVVHIVSQGQVFSGSETAMKNAFYSAYGQIAARLNNTQDLYAGADRPPPAR